MDGIILIAFLDEGGDGNAIVDYEAFIDFILFTVEFSIIMNDFKHGLEITT